jgi:rhomboid protease GluP
MFIVFVLLKLPIMPYENLALSIQSPIYPLSFILNNYMHANVMHILFNMIILYQFGKIIDNIYEIKEQILVYFYSGLAISVIMFGYIYLLNPSFSMLGFSGIACFMLGASLIHLNEQARNSILIQMALYHVFIIFMNLPVAWEAHLVGGVLGYLYSTNRFFKEDKRNNFKVIK